MPNVGNFYPRSFTSGLQYVANCAYADLPDPVQFADGTQAWVTDLDCVMVVSSGSWVSDAALIARQRVPLIKMPSFSDDGGSYFQLSANIDYAYPQCYGFFDAGTLAVDQPAGFYYCQMSSVNYGRVFQETYIPAAGVNPVVPVSPTPFPDPLVGGDGFIGLITFYVSNLPANLLGNAGQLGFGGLLLGTEDSNGLQLSIDGSYIYNFTGIGTNTAFSGTYVYAISSALQKLYLEPYAFWSNLNLDLSIDQPIILAVESTAIDSFATLTNYGIEVDNR